MKTKTLAFLAIFIGIIPFILFTPLLFSKLSLSIPFFAILAYVACLFSGKRLSNTYTGLALFGGWAFFVSFALLVFPIIRQDPPVENVWLIESIVLSGILIGYVFYILRTRLLKIAFGVLSLAFMIFMFLMGENAYQSRLYYGTWTGDLSIPLTKSLELTDEDGSPVRYDLSENKYSVIQIFHVGYGSSYVDVMNFMKPAFDKYRHDERVRFLVIGVPPERTDYLDSENRIKEFKDAGLFYARSNDKSKIIDMLCYSRIGDDGIVIVKRDTILFRGNCEMANRALERIVGR